ncbi:type II toxin-antitoxin system PemK/MazF family toxin [Pseudomonas sp. RIT411]|uniref:type II toxin-antitoxin system PemK/MazF family toxin n=1 Tax=Pseudomonas sp. RIT411 TaxID=2202160 RepID=UPI000D3C1EAF|nr:type II toxin-antitoxin system PemK/MazF family toxin [Pseudomonas sp. RIT 411]RAU39929.1 hypothetical protein DBY63_008995 [Pseudomonas sp. RIT 411]
MTKPFHPLPAPGDIVWCHFPSHLDMGNPGPKSRPALVVAVSSGSHAVKVAYGTSQKVDKIYPTEFVLSPDDGEPFAVSGLAAKTKFNLGDTVNVPFDSDWFHVHEGVHVSTPLPKMGVLHASYMSAARKALSHVP